MKNSFSSAVKIFEIFDGEKTKQKAIPYTGSKQMRSEKDSDGKRRFSPCEKLKHQQLRGGFGQFYHRKAKTVQFYFTGKAIKVVRGRC